MATLRFEFLLCRLRLILVVTVTVAVAAAVDTLPASGFSGDDTTGLLCW